MLPYKRSKRIGDLMREEIADIVMRRVKDPRLGFLTITSVEVTEDLKIARVYVSVLQKSETKSTLKILNSAKGFIRSELRKRVRMKVLPTLEFYEDESIEYGAKIDELLRRIKKEGESEGS
jgi:ribosome-binding factor A